jgi:diguanylate cyclase (GGDEF)-like protein
MRTREHADPFQVPPATPDADVLMAIVAAQTEIVSSALKLNAVMDLVCREARKLTRADGAVLEIAEGDEMVYRAAAGSGVAHIGLRLKQNGSLSGACIAAGHALRCEDAATDPRVDRAACERVGGVAMLCVPLVHQERTIGVLKVVSARQGAFDDRDETTLNLLSGLIAAQLLHAQDFQHITDAALEDGLTGLGNRRAYEERLASETERAIRHGRALTLALIDVDQLASINEARGHAVGDEVLRRVARSMCEVRVCDYGFRIDGDRFALLMPETTERQAEVVVRRIAHELERADRFGLAAPVSIGASQAHHRDPEILHTSAEDALARAKRGHRGLRRVA